MLITLDGWWMVVVWLRNLVLTFVVAHGLHLVFHQWALQGQDHKYDPRPYPRKGRMFNIAFVNAAGMRQKQTINHGVNLSCMRFGPKYLYGCEHVSQIVVKFPL